MTKFQDNYPPGYDGKADGFIPDAKGFYSKSRVSNDDFGDPIGSFKGVNITEMTRGQLLDFAKWAISRLENYEKVKADRMIEDLKQQANIRHTEYCNEQDRRRSILRKVMGRDF